MLHQSQIPNVLPGYVEQVAYCLIISESDLALVFNAHLDINLAGNDDTAILLVFNQ